ncbi:MAG: FecR domain-containing protein [Chthoniobacterales bacterium]
MKPTRFFTLIALASSSVFSLCSLQAEPLKKAEVTQIINQVGIIAPGSGERPASVNDVVEGKLGVRTGQKSRAELVFADETLTRLGANTIFNFEDGSRNMDLSQGTILLQVPKNAGGATIKTAAVTAAVTGTTILFEHTPAPVVPDRLKEAEKRRHRKPHGYIKALVLEGHLKVWLKGKLGESILLGPGQMLIMADDASEIPEAVDFDIETVVTTSRLIDGAYWLQNKRKLNMILIANEVFEQRKRKLHGDLIETNLFINGRGTTVFLANNDTRDHRRDSLTTKNQPSQPSPSGTPNSTPTATPTPGKSPTPGRTPSPTPIETPSPTPTESPSPTPTETPSPTPQESPSPTPGPTPENDLGPFTFEGATNTITYTTPANYDPTLPGNATQVNALFDNTGEGTDVFPTEGDYFGVISNGGAAPSGSPAPAYTGTRGTVTFPQTQPTNPEDKTFVEMDYRVLTNEFGGDSTTNDHVTFTITGVDGMKVTYVITRDQLLDSSGLPTAIARSNVGGYLTGTDWLTLKLELTPFLAAGESSFSIAVEDYESSDVDTALAFDRYHIITGDNSVPPNSNLIDSFTANFPNGVTFGESTGEYRAPSLEGIENTNTYGPGSNGGTFTATTETGDLVVNAPILADTGINKFDPNSTPPQISGGEGGTVNLTSNQASVIVNSTVKVAADDATSGRVSATGGAINVISERSGGDGVVINNSGELLSLLNAAASTDAGGKIIIRAGDSNVLINGGKIIATRGTVDIRAPGDNRKITVNNAEIRGDIVKIGALGNNGELIVGGGTISADNTLKLYGNDTNGTVRFVADTTLDGASQKIISANTVTVENTIKVTVNGPAATVYTNHANYTGSGGNNSTSGTFTGSGATTAPTPPPFD